MPDFANIKSIYAPAKKLSDVEILRAIKFAIASEFEAIQIYQEIMESTDNEDVKKVLTDIYRQQCDLYRVKGGNTENKMRKVNINTAADLLNHFYYGNGTDVKLSKEFMDNSSLIQSAAENNKKYLKERTFIGNSKKVYDNIQKIINNTPNNQGKVKYPIEDYWDFDNTNYIPDEITTSSFDTSASLGSFKLRSYFIGTAERIENMLRINGTLTHKIKDIYDFNDSDLGFTKTEYEAQKNGCAIPFNVEGSWQEEVIGLAKIDQKGKIIDTYLKTYEKEK